MRGTHSANSLRNPWSGIIPAYAGNTSHQHAERRSAWDHPRVCGEHHGSGLYSGCAAGSSPRMRGTHRRGTRSETAQGIIPAYAGNTSQCAALRALLRDHPRVCGEHRSPVSWRIPPTRIIPAYAGNTRFAQQICCVYRDHPQMRTFQLSSFFAYVNPPPREYEIVYPHNSSEDKCFSTSS